MKKITIFLSLLIAMAVTSCREEADYSGDPSNQLYGNSADSYAGQFKIVWNAINNGFNFWDISDVNWDARYKEFLPKFQAMDDEIKSHGGKADTMFVSRQQMVDSVNNGRFAKLYKELTAGLKDGHMALVLQDPYKQVYMYKTSANTEELSSMILLTQVQPVEEEINTRSYYHTSLEDSTMYKLVYKTLESSGLCVDTPDSASWRNTTSAAQSAGMDNGYYVAARLKLPGTDKIVPYIWLGHFSGIETARGFAKSNPDDPAVDGIRRALDDGGVYKKFKSWVCETPKEQLAGVILDVRENGGGAASDLKYFYGMFENEDKAFWEERHKDGMGKYDMTVWVPIHFGVAPNDTLETGQVILNRRDLAAENIPLVELCDLNSVSCSEITSQSVRGIGGYLIGERTHGGHGKLWDAQYAYDINYCGVVGDRTFKNYNYYIYTSNYESRPVGQKSLEGYGITPDLLIEHQPDETEEQSVQVYVKQFNAAIDYIKNKQ